jgi:hypothetical protein
VYEPATPLDLDEPLMIDPWAARLLAEWYQLGAQALSRLAAEAPGDQPSPAVLWPEHFDVGITAAAGRVRADGRSPYRTAGSTGSQGNGRSCRISGLQEPVTRGAGP